MQQAGELYVPLLRLSILQLKTALQFVENMRITEQVEGDQMTWRDSALDQVSRSGQMC